jgi:hypothetical protein
MDIFFISYREANCEENWQRVRQLHHRAKRIHGIQGIDRVHLTCNDNATTEFFWTVDGDNYLIRELDFDYSSVHSDLVMFEAWDPLQNTTTLLGGVKLWRRASFVNTDMSLGDFTLNATKNKQISDTVLSETRYNASDFDAWKTAFRHCVKCMTVIFRGRPQAKNLDKYIQQWRGCEFIDGPNADYAYCGYRDAVEYSRLYDNNRLELNKINDYDWLEAYFSSRYVRKT